MLPETFIFFGRSGSGKGTQADLLISYLQKRDPKRKVIHIETGKRIREFLTENTYTSKLTKEVVKSGGLLPAFLPIWVWTEYLIRNFSGNEHLVLDGLSRRASEAPVLDSALSFYDIKHPFIILLNVSREWSRERLLNRGRGDDTEADIKQRLDWYDNNVLPAIEFFRTKPEYIFVEINAEQPIEKVHSDILAEAHLL
ncbi:MAG: nucleoside monophosphate kinase [Patescibacteria group bacterium]